MAKTPNISMTHCGNIDRGWISTHPSFSWTLNSDKVLCSLSCLDITIALVANHSDPYGPSNLCPLNTHMVQMSAQILGIHTAFGGNRRLGRQHRPWIWQDCGPRNGSGHNLGLFVAIAPGDSTYQSGLHRSSSGTVHRHQCGHKWWPRRQHRLRW